MAKALRQLEQRIKQVDLVLEVRDARVPLSSFNPHLEKLVAAKRRLVLLNKTDLADPAATRAATALLTQQAGLRVLPCEALDGRSAGRVLDAVLDCMRSGRAPSPTTATSATASTAMPSFASGRASLARGPIAASTAAAGIGAGARTGAAAGPSPPDLRLVLIAGLPNTGKSSLINALRRAAAARGLLDGEQAWRKAARSGPLPGVTTALGGFRVCRSPAGAGHGAAHNGAGASAQHPTGRTRGLRPDPGHGAGVGPGDGDLGQVYVLDSPGVLAPALRDMGLGSGHGHGGQWGLPPKPGGGGKGGGGGGGPGGGRGARAQAWEQQGQEQPGDGGEATAARLAIAGLLPVDGRGGLVAEGRVLRHLVQLLMSDPRRLRELWCAADSQVHHMRLQQQLQEQRGGGNSRGSSSSRDGAGGSSSSGSSTGGDVRLARLVYEAVTAPLEQLLQQARGGGAAEAARWHPGLGDELDEEGHADGTAAEGGRGRRRRGDSRSSAGSAGGGNLLGAGPFRSRSGSGGGGVGRWDPLAAAAEIAVEEEQMQQKKQEAQQRAAAAETTAAAARAVAKRQQSLLEDPVGSVSTAFAAREAHVSAAEADARVEALLRRLTNGHRGSSATGGGGAVVNAGQRTAAQRAVLIAFRSGALGRYTWDDVPLATAAPVATATVVAAAAGAADAAAGGSVQQPRPQQPSADRNGSSRRRRRLL
ncbi:hypothetical protein CHLRE_01g010150v5 [Chlamydomonas reinhardtii]|uniref:Uncharacterized protein n=1 Tax=Chlamydomonas reinhardtii TaxID=3055 RepID=A0A2K3E5D1_CHLRE|nr:uncharacterized protein CHLRE_01g010150v5 [Chlamydomonas reinhardtii]PNW87998.1 hypothetical protein CHLRE_01g010150v5 [Chlamydomonas reinhardtii]